MLQREVCEFKKPHVHPVPWESEDLHECYADLRSETLKLPMSLLLSVPSVMATADKPDWCIRSKHCMYRFCIGFYEKLCI